MEPQFYDLNTGRVPNGQSFHMQQGQPPKKSKTEGAIGKIVMAVFASIFIALSILFFAMLVFPTLSDAAKLAVIYVVCIAFAATGTLLLVFLNSNNKAFLTISLCGTGLMYIAFFMSHYAFHMVPFGAMLLLVLLWSAFCAIFAREYSFVYQIVGQILVFGLFMTEAFHVNRQTEGKRVLLALVFYALLLLVFFVIDGKKEYSRNWINFTALAICPIPLLAFSKVHSLDFAFAKNASGVFLLLFMVAAMIFSVTFFKLEEKKSVGFGIFNSVYLVAMLCGLNILLPESLRWQEILGYIICFFAVLAWLVVIEFKFYGKLVAGAMIWKISGLILLGGIALCLDAEIELSILVCLLALGSLVYGYLMKQKSYKIAGLVYACLFMLQVGLEKEPVHAVLGAILLAVAGVLIFTRKDQYRALGKVLLFFGIQWLLCMDIGTIFYQIFRKPQLAPLADILQLFLVVAVTYLFAKLPILQKNLLTWEKENALSIATGIYNIILMLVAVIYILDEDKIGYCIAYILIGAAIFGMNSWNLIRQEQTSWPALYIGIKWFVFLLAAAGGLGAEGIGMSLIALFYSLLCIAIGFVLQIKLYRNYQNVRILGLVLVCLSLLKLLIYDIYYSSNLIRAIGFFVAGVLCFVISLVYHLVEKKMKETGRNER